MLGVTAPQPGSATRLAIGANRATDPRLTSPPHGTAEPPAIEDGRLIAFGGPQVGMPRDSQVTPHICRRVQATPGATRVARVELRDFLPVNLAAPGTRLRATLFDEIFEPLEITLGAS